MSVPANFSAATASGRFTLFLVLGMLAMCAAYTALVLNQATYPEVISLSHITFHNGSYQNLPVRMAAHEFVLAQRMASGVTGGLLLLLGLTAKSRKGQYFRALVSETKAVLAGVWRQLAHLTPPQRRVAGLSLALLTGVRVYFGIVKSYHSEEVASYDFFISRGLLAITGFYPIPNNHILPNTLNWLFFEINPNVWFTLRLPVLMTATIGTVALFAGLVRFGTFRTALIALTLFCWLQLSMYNAVAGRGYWFLITLAGIHFFAAVALLSRAQAPRVAWAVLLFTGVLGCFTVPSFAYVVVSSASYLGMVFMRRRDWASILQTAVVGAGIVAGAALLYVPLLLLSGWRLLLANGYVAARPWEAFWQELPRFFWFTEGTLAGQRTVGAVLFLAGMMATGWLFHSPLWTELAPDLKKALRQLGLPALWFVLVPYALLTVQRVLPPERVLLYKAVYFFALIGLVIDAWLRAYPGRWWPRLAGVGITFFVAYQTFTMYYLVVANQKYIDAIIHTFSWLQNQPMGRVMVGVNETSLHFLFFAHTRSPRRLWQFDSRPQPGVRYRYVIVSPDYQGPYRPCRITQPTFHNAVNEVYVLPAPGQEVPRDPALD